MQASFFQKRKAKFKNSEKINSLTDKNAEMRREIDDKIVRPKPFSTFDSISGKQYIEYPSCDFCSRPIDIEDDSETDDNYQDLENLHNLVEVVFQLYEELKIQHDSLKLPFGLNEIFKFEPTCCERSLFEANG